MYRADFHTHSTASPDGGIARAGYRRMLQEGKLDYIAITDHNTIGLALDLHAELGDKIIIGEEITTRSGEIIGLFLSEQISPMLSLEETIMRIKQQHAIVYVPHPFETVRSGINYADLTAIASEVDVIELHNGRAVFQNRTADASAWASMHGVAGAASSDSHGMAGWGRTYTLLQDKPSRQNLVQLLATAEHAYASPGLRGVLYPKFNRLHKQWRRHD